jgi:Zn-finger nucleic acid-binding protein
MNGNQRILCAWSELIKERGWTDGLIKKHLGEPDEFKKNPHYKSGPPMRLFLLERVEEIEAQSEVAESIAKVIARRPALSAAAILRADAQRNDLLDAVASVKIEIVRFEPDELRRRAIASYNSLWLDRGKLHKRATASDDPDFLDRITRNYARHHLVDYDSILTQLSGRVGKNDAYWLFKNRVMARIYELYPHLDPQY